MVVYLHETPVAYSFKTGCHYTAGILCSPFGLFLLPDLTQILFTFTDWNFSVSETDPKASIVCLESEVGFL